MDGKKRLLLLLTLVLLLTAPLSAWGDVSGWRILDSQQNGDALEVWFATDEQISSGRVIYNYGGIPLRETNLSTTEGVGYIFVVDNTSYYSQATVKDPRPLIEGAIRRMSNYDSVAFIGIRQGDLGKNTEFVLKGGWEQAYNSVLGTGASSSSTKEYTWEAISKGVAFAQEMYQAKKAREMVMILITDGAARGPSKTADTCLAEIQKLSFTLPFYCLHLTPTKDEGKFIEFAGKLAMGASKTVTIQNVDSIAGDCVVPFSNLIYKSRLDLGPEIYSAQGENLTISLAGSQKGASQDAISLNFSLIPSPTPEPTATPEPTPTPEINPQFVGEGTGNEHDIWELQRVLIQLGFMPSDAEPSGMWDMTTGSAVNLYYSMNGISTSRIPAKGGMTLELYQELMAAANAGTVVTPTPVPTASPTPEPTPVPTVDPERGLYIGYDTEDRSLVRLLNRALKDKYYLEADLDISVYSDATQQAVEDFYNDHPNEGLNRPDAGEGITRRAFEVLCDEATLPKTTPEPTPEPTPDPNPAYISYSSDDPDLIAELNHALADRFFVEDPSRIVWSQYTDETNNAVLAFYEYYESLNVQKDAIPRPTRGAGITKTAYEFLLHQNPKPTATPILDLQFTFSAEDLKSPEAISAAQRLKELGYLEQEDNPDAFRKAAILFAQRNKLSEPDKYLDKATYQAILREDARPAQDPPGVLVPGTDQEKEQVVVFQEALDKLKYFRDIQDKYKTGFFDEPTQKAYRRFCEVSGLEWDGGEVSWEEQKKVLESKTENPALNLFENTKQFVTGHYELFGRDIPMWILLAAAALILIGVIVVIVLLVKGQKKSGSKKPGAPSFMPSAPSVNVSVDAPTDEVAESVSTGLDAPTVDPEGCVLSLMITNPQGISRDGSYNVQDGEQLVIGRGSSADIVTDTEDLSVSRSHGIFRYNARSVSYEDTSSHYTVVDGERIHLETRQLTQGSQLQIGKSFIKVQWS